MGFTIREPGFQTRTPLPASCEVCRNKGLLPTLWKQTWLYMAEAWHVTQVAPFSREYEEETRNTTEVHDKGDI